jgi:hypothetical protein
MYFFFVKLPADFLSVYSLGMIFMLLYRAMLTLHKISLHAHAVWVDVLNPCEYWVIQSN